MAAKKSCMQGKYGSFEHLLFLTCVFSLKLAVVVVFERQGVVVEVGFFLLICFFFLFFLAFGWLVGSFVFD